MIEVFKTDVRKVKRVKELSLLLQQQFPDSKINFDLTDCDKVLRVEGENILPEHITSLLLSHGCNCEALK